ncbi:hypothetical protein A4X06_0g5430 [Tilletia controversa]|uniref:Uncharacterized protein n=1 Tax=Tilletia controversa TaxID=13291 RepID=A0A8X7SVP5_9BASI|nr:hypothetical protein A4X06_0g5430 [Tilletia controversa]
MGVAEARGMETLVSAAVDLGERDCVLLVLGDNKGVLYGWQKGRSASAGVNETFLRMSTVATSAGTLLQPQPLPSRRPVRLDDLLVIRNGLEIHNDRAHAAIWACVSFAFFSLARIGEVTADLSAPRDPTARALRYHWSLRPPDGIVAATVTLRLPIDKTQGPTGSDLIASSQASSSPQICPVHAVHHHLLVNAAVPADAGPFAYIDCDGHPRELTGSFCTDTANAILAAANTQQAPDQRSLPAHWWNYVLYVRRHSGD